MDSQNPDVARRDALTPGEATALAELRRLYPGHEITPTPDGDWGALSEDDLIRAATIEHLGVRLWRNDARTDHR